MPKKIIICFDGTCNHPKDARQEREWLGFGDIEDNGITNILKLHVMLGGYLTNEQYDGSQHSLYYSGVGTYGNRFQQIFNAAFAPKNLDIGDIINRAGGDLKQTYRPGDEIFVFGFSRGAAIARRFCSVLRKYLPEVKEGEKAVRFLGVFDTVASIGMPNLDDDDKPTSDVVFENNQMSAHVKEALHLVSIDENRTAFLPTLIARDKRATEIWFPGAHADVGGGFWHDGLSDMSLGYMLNQFIKRKLGLMILMPGDINYSKLKGPQGHYQIDEEDVYLEPDHLGKAHPKDRWQPIAKATLCKREIRVNGKNDRPVNELPLLHSSVVSRIKEDRHYRPKNLKGLKYGTIDDDGNIVEQVGLRVA